MAKDTPSLNKNESPKGGNIRGFFSKTTSQSTATASSQSVARVNTLSQSYASQPHASGSVSTPKRPDAMKIGNKFSAIEISSDEEPRLQKAPSRKDACLGKKSTPSKPIATQAKNVDLETSALAVPKKVEGLLARPKKPSALAFSDSDEDEVIPPAKKPSIPQISSAIKKGKRKVALDSSEDSEEYEEERPKAKKKQVTDLPSNSKRVLNEAERKKSNWAASEAARIARASGPSAPGSKIIPEPKTPDCLHGLKFVFTGEMSSISREQAIELVKRYGGNVTGQPSGATSYVILGEYPGPSKLAALKKHGVDTLTEDGFLELIATRIGPSKTGGKLDPKFAKKMEKEEAAIKVAAKALEKAERQAKKDPTGVDPTTQLWTTRYAPTTLKEICGNKASIEKLSTWLNDWDKSRKSGWTKPGKDAMNSSRAVLITGPPGIGKTTSAHLCAKIAGFTPIEVNASDARSKKLVESGTNINNTSLDGWRGGGTTTVAGGVAITNKSCLIMDEVDGMSAGDRGGVGALTALIKKSQIPIICIANDRNAPKLKPLLNCTFNLPFKKPDTAAVRSRLMTISYKEKMKIPANVIDQLINGSQSDIRQVLNMLSTWKLSSCAMDFDEGKNLAKMNEKYSTQSPFDMTSKLLGPYMFSKTSQESLDDKMHLYFQDHAFMPLFMQENYLKTQPARSREVHGPQKALNDLRLMDQAATSVSDGDLVDALIHGPEQHWGLMPLHAICSVVRPASFLYGQGANYGSQYPIAFPAWLGQNSKQGKLGRQLGEMQIRMRLKVSGDKGEIRQSYLPAFYPFVVQPLIANGASAVEEVIKRMDDYFLSKEDWDTLVELGVGDQKDSLVLKSISTATKTNFTRKYNASEHPIPFYKGSESGKAPKKLVGDAAPDMEEVVEVDEDLEAISEDEKKPAADDFNKDKMLKTKGQQKTSATKSKAKSKKF